MSEFLTRVDGGELIAIISVGGGLLIALLSIGVGAWHKVRAEQISADLKRDMLDRGMSADEIKTVLEAGPSRPPAMSVSWKKSGIRQ
jgi:hypothetical protein